MSVHALFCCAVYFSHSKNLDQIVAINVACNIFITGAVFDGLAENHFCGMHDLISVVRVVV